MDGTSTNNLEVESPKFRLWWRGQNWVNGGFSQIRVSSFISQPQKVVFIALKLDLRQAMDIGVYYSEWGWVASKCLKILWDLSVQSHFTRNNCAITGWHSEIPHLRPLYLFVQEGATIHTTMWAISQVTFPHFLNNLKQQLCARSTMRKHCSCLDAWFGSCY